MSMLACDKCGLPIDTDSDDECWQYRNVATGECRDFMAEAKKAGTTFVPRGVWKNDVALCPQCRERNDAQTVEND